MRTAQSVGSDRTNSPRIIYLTQGSQWVSHRRQGGEICLALLLCLALSGLVVMVAERPSKYCPWWSLVQPSSEVRTANGCRKTCISAFSESITIPDRAPKEYSLHSAQYVSDLLRSEDMINREVYRQVHVREHGCFSRSMFMCFDRGLKVSRADLDFIKICNVECRRFPVIFYPALNEDRLRRNCVKSYDPSWTDRQISTQLSIGMPFTAEPQSKGGSEQCDSEQRHYRGADRNYFGVVLSDKLKAALDKALFAAFLIFFFTGPLIGFGLLFLNRWLGGSVMLSWLYLIWYALSGLWQR
jgi:hypothetical protein